MANLREQRRTRGAVKGVSVSRDVVEIDNGVNTGDIKTARALHTPEGVGTTGQAE